MLDFTLSGKSKRLRHGFNMLSRSVESILPSTDLCFSELGSDRTGNILVVDLRVLVFESAAIVRDEVFTARQILIVHGISSVDSRSSGHGRSAELSHHSLVDTRKARGKTGKLHLATRK